ncbi:RNA binding motif protein, putative [Pediculus humanus corporis]|uniref:RNA binding motif protein, putative n=1 Tax=Pediculus humanus subsp. corporis TaxID=121224 RepID=E0VMX2_PEDHC|nr:RNA binding motif protein, putative [Pediculus humanus corporis]EEB14728.1 RNA binding motif protein, putative [Pediculus humanus corporis]
MSRLIVKNLPGLITKEKLHQIFSEQGVVTDVQLKYTKEGKFRKFAFIGFQKPEYAEKAKAALNKTFINMSKIQVETCAELGDPNKPRPWSKYAPENVAKKKKKQTQINHNESKKKLKMNEKEKIKDKEVKELLKNHENDDLFSEFMKIHVPDLSINSDKKLENVEEEIKNTNKNENEDSENNKEETNVLANQDIPDSEYIKLKTGQNILIKTESKSSVKLKKNGKEALNIELFTIKLRGLPLEIKKSQIKEFLKPNKPFSIRKALRMRGTVFCGFKTEKEMKQALRKNKSFLGGKRIYVSEVRKDNMAEVNEKEKKWEAENERLKKSETVAESGRIFIRNLPYTVTENELKEVFEKYGPVIEFILPIDSFTRKPKGFGIVTYLIPEHACKAYNELDGTIFSGRMLHLLPALPNNEFSEEDLNEDSFKKKKMKKEQSKINSTANWNTFFIGENALAEVVAATYKTSKESVLDDKKSGAAVRLALGETQFVNKMKEFLEENNVCLDSFENMSVSPRSNTVILVKNLPFGTTSEEISEKFRKFGLLSRVVVPPSGVAALVEFAEPSEARIAFRRLSYSKFKHVPLYLEWAPEKVFSTEAKPVEKIEKTCNENLESEKSTNQNQSAENETQKTTGTIEEQRVPEEGTVIFVKNLNFATNESSLRKHFEACGTVLSVTIARKKDPKEPGKSLSMGYGFVEFSLKEEADKALKTLQFTNLDDHKIELKRSNRTTSVANTNSRNTYKKCEKPSSKILVRNVPFQATKREIGDLFKVFGEIKAIRLPKKLVGSGSHRGFCFVEYNTVQDAKRAFNSLSQSTHLYGRRLVLEWAAVDDDIENLRIKTAEQFNAGL